MGFLSKMAGSVVKTALTPVAIAKDVIDVACGDEPENTKNLVQSAVKDAGDAMDDLTGGL